MKSGGKNTSVTNDVTTGSMYAVTLDTQSITPDELQNIFQETADLKDTVSPEKVYDEAYIGKLLSLAGKLYFAQVDVVDGVLAEMYGVSATRSLSEGITGYEVRTSSLYGQITSISEGSLYIDVDTDVHSVVSLNAEKNSEREFFLVSGFFGSLYESTVWEELTGCESVSTISILNAAKENGVNILMLGKENFAEDFSKLSADANTKCEVENAVKSGKIVIIPERESKICEWSGTSYIVMNPETGAAAYMISGGLNGGSTSTQVTIAYIANILFSVWDLAEAIMMVSAAITAILAGSILGGAILGLIGVVLCVFAIWSYVNTLLLMIDYLSGNEEAGKELISDAKLNGIIALIAFGLGRVSKPFLKKMAKNKLVRELGEEFVEKMLRKMDVDELNSLVRNLRKLNLSDNAIKEFVEKFGKEGADWLLKKQALELSDDLVKKLLKADDLSKYSNDILRIIKNSDGYADDIIEQITKYGDDAVEAIEKYGDDAAEVIKKYGDQAIHDIKAGYSPKEIRKVQNYIYGIANNGVVDTTKMNNLRLALENGKLDDIEKKLLSKNMDDLGIVNQYEDFMREKMDFGKYLTNMVGPYPSNMVDPHAHHILFKKGLGDTQQALVTRGQRVLRKYGIDPVIGEENLVWAPNRIKGQHTAEALEPLVEALEEVERMGGDYEQIVEVLQEFGTIASERIGSVIN